MLGDPEVGGTERVSDEKEGGIALPGMMVPGSLSDMEEPFNLTSISVEASKRTKVAGGMETRGATSSGSSRMGSTRMGFS